MRRADDDVLHREPRNILGVPLQLRFIRQNHGDYFSVSVAGYPEGHPDNIEAGMSVNTKFGPCGSLRQRLMLHPIILSRPEMVA